MLAATAFCFQHVFWTLIYATKIESTLADFSSDCQSLGFQLLCPNTRHPLISFVGWCMIFISQTSTSCEWKVPHAIKSWWETRLVGQPSEIWDRLRSETIWDQTKWSEVWDQTKWSETIWDLSKRSEIKRANLLKSYLASLCWCQILICNKMVDMC